MACACGPIDTAGGGLLEHLHLIFSVCTPPRGVKAWMPVRADAALGDARLGGEFHAPRIIAFDAHDRISLNNSLPLNMTPWRDEGTKRAQISTKALSFARDCFNGFFFNHGPLSETFLVFLRSFPYLNQSSPSWLLCGLLRISYLLFAMSISRPQ